MQKNTRQQMTHQFRFAPDILRRLGEELIPHAEQGLLELVRNSYDANASTCTVELIETENSGGTIRVLDNGLGMTLSDIDEGWLILGRSRKSAVRKTAPKRLPVGDKGLGRLAALRLGAVATIRSRPESEPGVEYELTLDWARFETAAVIEDVQLEVIRRKTKTGKGTDVELRQLRHPFGVREVSRLARALVLLADPFVSSEGIAGVGVGESRKKGTAKIPGTTAFRPILRAPEFVDYERLVRQGYLSDADYHLIADLLPDGTALARVVDWKGSVLFETGSKGLKSSSRPSTTTQAASLSTDLRVPVDNSIVRRDVYAAPAARLELWTFLLRQQSFHVRTTSVTQLRDWLSVVGGVHLYHRGLRVLPYGDPGHDWLDMNLARVASPEERPSTNNSVGRVVVLDTEEQLLQKTDRTGFVENSAFEELRRFAQDALEWMASVRIQARDARDQREKKIAPKAVEIARTELASAVKRVPPRARPVVQKAVDQLEIAHKRQLQSVQSELELYRTLGTVGTTIAVFAHESARPVQQIEQMVRSIRKRAQQELGQKRYTELLSRPVDIISRSVVALKTYANVPLRLLSRSKRRVGRVNVNEAIEGVITLFEPFFETHKIRLEVKLLDEKVALRGTISALEAIVTNLITNAIAALSGPDAPAERLLLVRTQRVRNRLLIGVLDNGPGIHGITEEEIWLPGRTTRTDGTGLGLTIVRDAAADLGGRANMMLHGELGGAEFIVDLPSLGDSIE